MRDKLPDHYSKDSCTRMLCNLLDQENDKGAAILTLVNRYVNHFAKRYCNLSFHERQDIRQEVAVSLIAHSGDARKNCSKSWIYAVVRNRCIDYIRKRSNQLAVIDEVADPEAESYATGPLPPLNEGVDAHVIQEMDCLQKIFDRIEARETGKEDIAIYTQYAFGLSYVEISQRSQRTVDAIGQRISKLKRRLRTLMNECC